MNYLVYSLFIFFFALHVISADEVGLVDTLDTKEENILQLDIQINEGENVVLGCVHQM